MLFGTATLNQNQVFDSNLYYKNGVYRTLTMMDVFELNELIMSVKCLLM